MSDLFFADLVRERTTSVGTGPLALDGATPGHRTFAPAVPPGESFHYAIAGLTHEDEWEIGVGTIDVGGQLVRTALRSSAGETACAFSEGVKTVALIVASDWFTEQSAGGGGGGGSTGPINMADVDGLIAALAGKQAAGDYAAGTHGHALSDVTGLTVQAHLASDDVLMAKSAADAGLSIAGNSVMARHSNGNFGVNVATPAVTFHLADAGNANDGEMRLGAHATYRGSIRYEFNTGFFHIGAFASGATLMVGNVAVQPSDDNNMTLGGAANRWNSIYAASGTISTSDERAKTDIAALPDAWLDAWGDVQWCRYKFVDGSRWHVGLIAQRVRDAFAARGLDACEIGLLCFDAWDGGDRWGLRYEECFAMEAAWVRRELAQGQIP